jgi:hypothetical protein
MKLPDELVGIPRNPFWVGGKKMPSIFGRIKKKKAEWDKKKEETKVAQIQKQIDENSEKFKENLGKQLGKLGLSLTYVSLTGADAKVRNAGSIIARFSDKEGYPITLVQNQAVYEGTPHGALTEMRKVYWSAAMWGTIVQGPIPFTLLFKQIGKGFMKGTARVFLPLTSLPFNEKELLNSQLLQTPVVAALNADKKLCDTISKFALGFSLSLTYKAWLTVSCPDVAGKCVIVPAKDETAIFLRNYSDYGEPKTMLETLSKIREHVLAHPHSEKVAGKIPAPWINTMYALSKAKFSDSALVRA